MTLTEKLRFLADRVEDGEEFYWGDVIMKFDSERLTKHLHGEWFYSDIKVNTIDYRDIKIKPKWEFTEDEKAILRNLPEKYNWIVRDETTNILIVYANSPSKYAENSAWGGGDSYVIPFKHIFQCIQWEDEEPCEFRRYI